MVSEEKKKRFRSIDLPTDVMPEKEVKKMIHDRFMPAMRRYEEVLNDLSEGKAITNDLAMAAFEVIGIDDYDEERFIRMAWFLKYLYNSIEFATRVYMNTILRGVKEELEGRGGVRFGGGKADNIKKEN